MRRPDLLALATWFDQHRRDLPWRRHRDPWVTWVSEMMLQQTTAGVVAKRLPDFLERFPTLESLASAQEEEVLQAWAGLGYYRRARTLHEAAGIVQREHGGRIPEEVEALQALPGVGSYTAGAIATMAFDRDAAAIDGNVARVFSRLFREERPIESVRVRKDFEAQAIALRPPEIPPSRFAEAWIELGALVCRPVDPDCAACPVAGSCAALKAGEAEDYPIRRPRAQSKPVQSTRALIRRGDRTLLVARSSSASLLPGWLELPGRWGPPGESARDVLAPILESMGLEQIVVGESVTTARHAITVHRIAAQLHPVEAKGRIVAEDARWLHSDELETARITTESKKLLVNEAEV